MTHRNKNITFLTRILSLLVIVFFSIAGIYLFPGCESHKELKIALSKGAGSSHYGNYSIWLKANNPNSSSIDLYSLPLPEALKSLENCDGLVLTGGPDVSPYRYGKADDSSRCELDLKRDTLEFQLIKKAIELKMPVLAICRGEQIFNVAYGGSLIVDIPSDYGTKVIHGTPNPDRCYHNINIDPKSSLFKICKVSKGIVNSNHHQAVSQIAENLKVSARTDDGIIEAIEWKNPVGKPFMMGVQWHPERLRNNEPLSANIAKAFLEQAMNYKKLKN